MLSHQVDTHRKKTLPLSGLHAREKMEGTVWKTFALRTATACLKAMAAVAEEGAVLMAVLAV